MTLLPLTLTLAFSPFTVLHIFPIALRLLKNTEVKVNAAYYEDKGILPRDRTNKDYYKKVVHLLPLILTGIGIYIGLLVVHIFSIVRLLEYGNKVLSSNYTFLSITHAVCSLLAVIIGFSLSVIFLVIKILRSKRGDKNNKKWYLMLPAAVISVNIFYLGCYFLPYMLLAFIHDPLQSIFTYLTVVFFALSTYLIILGFWYFYKRYSKKHKIGKNDNTDKKSDEIEENDKMDKTDKMDNNDKIDKKSKLADCCDTLLYSCMVWAMAFSIILLVLLTIFFIESFDDFQKLQDLTPSLLIAVISVVLLTPTYKYSIKHLEGDNHDDDNKKRQQEENQNQPGENNELAMVQVSQVQNDTTRV